MINPTYWGDTPITLNYWAILVAALSSYVLGALWYSPLLFGKLWVKLMGWSHEQMEHHKKGAARGYIVTLVTALVSSLVMAHVVDYTWSYTAADGATTGFWIWLGFVATVMIGGVLWEGKKFSLYILNTAYQLASLVLMGVILAVWK